MSPLPRNKLHGFPLKGKKTPIGVFRFSFYAYSSLNPKVRDFSLGLIKNDRG